MCLLRHYYRADIKHANQGTRNSLHPSKYATSLVAQMVRSLPAMQETWVLSLGWEDPKEMATHSSNSCLENPFLEEPGRLVHGVARVGHN